MNATIIGLIVVPVSLFLLVAIGGAVKGIIRFAQYLAHTEEALDKIATSNQGLRDDFTGYQRTTDERFEVVNERVHGIDRRLFSVENSLGR